MKRVVLVALLSGTSAAFVSVDAKAEDPRPMGSVSLGHAVGSPQDRELGFGGGFDVGIEVPVAPVFGIEGRLGGVALLDGSPPRDPRLADRKMGLSALLLGGARIGKRQDGPWGDFGAGLAATGVARFAFDLRAGYDFSLDRRGRFYGGPMLGYLHVLQPDDSLRPEDAHIALVGMHVAYGKPSGPCADSDRDGICDDRDACPDERGIKSELPSQNGCPRRDRDGDTVFDDEDACPDVKGVRTKDPATNGCPIESDRDNDEILDERDACPDVPGPPSDNPKEHGCPAKPDRDGDSVADDEDACPDIPGVKTDDPKTNGCPPAAGAVRIEGDRLVLDDRIHFDLDSPRVRQVSWALVEKIARFILATPDILEIDIEGHADRIGTDEHNLRLSRERAEAVRKMLVKYGVQPARLNARGYGESRPITSKANISREDRRVEFWVVKARPAQPSKRATP